MADTQPQPAVDSSSEQVTSKIPTTAPAKNPKRVAAGEAVAEKTRQARAAQKKAATEVAVIIENNKADRQAQKKAKESLDISSDSSSILTTTQWLSVFSILVSVIGFYLKHEEIKRVFSKPQTPPPSSDSSSRQTPPQSPDSSSQQPKKGIRPMD